MARYILIDNCSGFIWGDSADLGGKVFIGTPLEYAAALDAHVGPPAPREYEDCYRSELASDETGYHVYRADVNGSEAIAVVNDGQDRETVLSVLDDCEYVTTIRCTDRED